MKLEREFKRSIELNPNVAYTHVAYASSLLLPLGRTNEALVELKRAVELEPLALINNALFSHRSGLCETKFQCAGPGKENFRSGSLLRHRQGVARFGIHFKWQV